MIPLLLDIWQDLRRKRLWPVAAALIVAAVAVPLFVIEPGPDADGAALPLAPAGGTDPSSIVTPEGASEAGSSSLDRFSPKDPFAPGLPRLGDESEVAVAAPSGTQIDRGSSLDSAQVGGVSATSPPVGSGGAGSSTGSSGSSTPTSSGTSTTSSGGSTEKESERTGSTSVRLLTYEVDLKFGPAGEARRRNGVEALELLPKGDPLILLNGVTTDGEVAVFSILDSEAKARGDGHCYEIDGRCVLLSLSEGDGVRIRDSSGEVYKLRVIEIRRVPVDG